jgi:hypothetical protein
MLAKPVSLPLETDLQLSMRGLFISGSTKSILALF